ncbi:MAG: hypothetical protein ABSF38_00635 [Verrucomicrobiota bacterium]|jgi:hypothetical protein
MESNQVGNLLGQPDTTDKDSTNGSWYLLDFLREASFFELNDWYFDVTVDSTGKVTDFGPDAG